MLQEESLGALSSFISGLITSASSLRYCTSES